MGWNKYSLIWFYIAIYFQKIFFKKVTYICDQTLKHMNIEHFVVLIYDKHIHSHTYELVFWSNTSKLINYCIKLNTLVVLLPVTPKMYVCMNTYNKRTDEDPKVHFSNEQILYYYFFFLLLLFFIYVQWIVN